MSADITTKNRILRHLHANSVLYDKKLFLQVIYPYTAFIETNKKPQSGADNVNWCSKQGFLRGLEKAAIELEQDVQFRELASVLQLDSSLLAV